MPSCEVCGRRIKKGTVGPTCAKKLTKQMALDQLEIDKGPDFMQELDKPKEVSKSA